MKAEGHAVRIHFKNAGGGLTIAAAPSTQPGVPQEKPASEIKGFAIAGPDKQFYWATAKIVSPDTVEVSSDKVEHPVAVRYAWDDNPAANLYNKESLPASPFRTDDWPLKQQEQVRRPKAKAKAQ
jgi:sialate O-acetylesterase